MKLLVLDTETTGVDPHKDAVIEIAAAVYDTTLKMVLWQMASLVPGGATANPAEHINRIPVAALLAADGFFDPFEEVNHYAGLCDAVIAHNGAFDRRMLGTKFTSTIPWICTQRQLVFPHGKGGKLTHLCADHGINTAGLHRAMADVTLIIELLKCTPNIDVQIGRAQLPQGLFMALVSFEQKQMAKDQGFSWNGTKKRWEREFPLCEVKDILLPFKIQQVQP